MEKFAISTVISDLNLATHQQKVRDHIKDKTIIKHIDGVSLITIPTPQGVGLRAVPYAYIEHECTKEEHAQWRFNQSLNQ